MSPWLGRPPPASPHCTPAAVCRSNASHGHLSPDASGSYSYASLWSRQKEKIRTVHRIYQYCLSIMHYFDQQQ